MYEDQILLKDNPACILLQDAQNCLNQARASKDAGDDFFEKMWSRIAVLLFSMALEAFINYVYTYCDVDPRQWRNLSFRNKWLQASAKCLPNMGDIIVLDETVYRRGDPVQSFNEDESPFTLFLELKSVRNQLVHLKPSFRAVPVADIIEPQASNDVHPETGIPKKIDMFNLEHAEAAERVYNLMTSELDRQMFGTILELFDGQSRVEVRADSTLGEMIELLISEGHL